MTAWKPAGLAAWLRVNIRFFMGTLLLAGTGAVCPGIAATPTDADGDGITVSADNCSNLANASQLDADRDGYGNLCDADLDNNGITNSFDSAILRSVLGRTAGSSATAAAADLDGNGSVNSWDGARLRASLGKQPGPSGLATIVPQGSATISWLPPTQRTDGSVLSNLAGYQIRFGTTAGALSNTIRLSNPGLTIYLVENLAPGTWYFAMVAVDSAGATSALSAIRSKTIS
jgi:hypothetical protein